MTTESLKRLLESRHGMSPSLLDLLLREDQRTIDEILRIYNDEAWQISLGLRSRLRNFSISLDAPYFSRWDDWVTQAIMSDTPEFMGSIIANNMEKAEIIHFNLDGFDPELFQLYLNDRSLAGINTEDLTGFDLDIEGITNWEYNRVIQNEQLLNKTRFYDAEGRQILPDDLYRPN